MASCPGQIRVISGSACDGCCLVLPARGPIRHYPTSSLRFVGVADLREAVPVVFAQDYAAGLDRQERQTQAPATSSSIPSAS